MHRLNAGLLDADVATRARTNGGFSKRQVDELSIGSEPKLDKVGAATARSRRDGLPIK
jgi:hypothetical protein